MTIKLVTGTLIAGSVLIGSIFGGVMALDQRYVSTAQFLELSVEVYYSQFYETLDRMQIAKTNEQAEYVKELERRFEKLKAKICELEPEWQRCDGPA